MTICKSALCTCFLVAVACGCASPKGEVPKPAANTTLSSASLKSQVDSVHEQGPSLIDLVKSNTSPAAEFAGDGWQPLFNGTNMTGWKEVGYGGAGQVEVGPGFFILNMGGPFSGLRYTNEFPTTNIEVALDAMRCMGSDFFCALTVPVSESHCSLVVGGWGGSLVGISSLNGLDASENETTKFLNFDNYRWYRIRMRVTSKRLEAWIDQDKVVDVVISSKHVSLRPGEIEECKPVGLATWQTAGAYRNLQFRRVDGPADPPPKSIY